jgi:hypothetical protein
MVAIGAQQNLLTIQDMQPATAAGTKELAA